MSVPSNCAIVGLGLVLPETAPRTERDIRRLAVEQALADAGLERHELDGYIATGGKTDDLRYLGLQPRFACAVNADGASACYAILTAAGAIAAGQVRHVLITYATAPRMSRNRLGSYSYGYGTLYGLFGPPAIYALHAQRHMHLYGTTVSHLGSVAVNQRRYALGRPESVGYGQPMSLEDHANSRMIADPLRLLDCTRDTTDVAVAIVVSAATATRTSARHTVRIAGIGFGHNIRRWQDASVYESTGEIASAAHTAFSQAGITREDVDVAQLYDAFTISVLMQIEAYGFCPVGSGGPFSAAGETGPEGAIPVNTGGGSLSGFYAQGFTPIVEAVKQLRGQGGASQVPNARIALVSGTGGNAGVQNTSAHATLVLEGSE